MAATINRKRSTQHAVFAYYLNATERGEDTIRSISLRKALKHERGKFEQASEMDWERIDKMTDEEIDTSDIPPLDDEFFATAQWRVPKRKTVVTLSVDDDVLK